MLSRVGRCAHRRMQTAAAACAHTVLKATSTAHSMTGVTADCMTAAIIGLNHAAQTNKCEQMRNLSSRCCSEARHNVMGREVSKARADFSVERSRTHRGMPLIGRTSSTLHLRCQARRLRRAQAPVADPQTCSKQCSAAQRSAAQRSAAVDTRCSIQAYCAAWRCTRT